MNNKEKKKKNKRHGHSILSRPLKPNRFHRIFFFSSTRCLWCIILSTFQSEDEEEEENTPKKITSRESLINEQIRCFFSRFTLIILTRMINQFFE